jgi:hypothetical protein
METLIGEAITRTRCKIRCKFWVPIPDVCDPADETAILKTLPADHPLKVALTGGGTVLLTSKDGMQAFPVRKVNLRSLNIVPASLCDEDLATHGLAIRLPDDLARMVHAYEACHEGVDYKWKPFFNFYANDLGKESGRRLRRLLAARINGISGQVVTDVRCKRGEVMVAAKAAEKLLKTVQKQYPELNITTVEQMDGLRVLLQRFPVMGHKGCRWITLRIVKDRPSMLIYVNAIDWNKLHGGDEDGDLGYIGIPRNSSEVKLVTVAQIAAWPNLVLKNHEPVIDLLLSDWVEKGNAEKVQTVTNFFTKDCIGPQTYMVTCLARAAAFEYSRGLTTAGERREGLGKITRGTFKANAPLAENTFDGRKEAGDALARFLTVVDAFQDAVAGKPFTVEPFLPFLENDEQRGLLAAVIKLAGGSLRSCRSTAYGTIVASGRKISGMVWDNRANQLVPRAGQIIDRLLTMGIQPEDMMDRLEDCAMGIRFIEMPRRDNTWMKGQVDDVTEDMDAELAEETGDEEETPGQLLVPTQVRGIQEILQSVQFDGVSVFTNLTVTKREEGDLLIEARLREAWRRGNQRTWKVEIGLPNPAASTDITPDGHKKVAMDGIEPRLFLPRFIWTGKNIEVQRFDSFLANVLAEAVGKVGARMGSLEAEEVSEELNMQIRRLLNELPTWVEMELPVRMAEFEVVVASTGEMKADWIEKEAALTVLAEHGYDVTTTSKNAPGTIVTKSWKRGIPRYLFAVNPMIPCLDLKRRPEGRERRLALKLFKPVAASVRSIGSKLPAVMQESQTELVCVVGDVLGYNLFVDEEGEEFSHDTGIVLEAGVEALALAQMEFSCASQEEVDDLTGRLLEAGIGIDAIEVERNLNLLGEGLSIDTFRVHVEAKITDLGKVKACIGPFKFVMNPIPHRLYAVNPDGTRTEIHVILPGTTVRKKKALDALLYMLAARAGITEIDPDFDPMALLLEIRVALRQQWTKKKPPTEEQLERLLNGMQPIVAVNPDGKEEMLGFAVVGVLPFYRPVQTGFSQFKVRTGEGGIKVQTHAMLMAGGVGFDIPHRLKEEFADIVSVRRKVKLMQCQEEEVLFDAEEQLEAPADL